MSHRENAALLVPYTADEMFNLVIDIDHYPEFVPGYLETRVLRRTDEMLYVEQKVGFGPVTTTFFSQARYEKPLRIEIQSRDKPFDLLQIDWSFQPVRQEACRVIFDARARLESGLAGRMLQPWIDRLGEYVPAAFAKRARQLYGHRDGPGLK